MFSADLSTREYAGHAVVTLGGELDVMDAESAAEALSVIAARERIVIVDLAGLKFLDASGLAALMRARKHARTAGGELLLAAPQRPVLLVLSVTRLVDVPPVHTCLEDAAKAAEEFRADAPVTARPA